MRGLACFVGVEIWAPVTVIAQQVLLAISPIPWLLLSDTVLLEGLRGRRAHHSPLLVPCR